MLFPVFLFLALLFALMGVPASAQAPARLLPEELRSRPEEQEILAGPFPGAMLIDRDGLRVLDDRYRRAYHTTVTGYSAEQEEAGGPILRYARRFVVHTPDPSALPLARRVMRELLLLYGENRARLRFDHPGRETVEVWLTAAPEQSAEVGGEQFRNQIYLYDLYAERAPIEWAREVAHEYGHYALPGVTGFTDPEAWANGVLGERLFLKWLREDLTRGRIAPGDLPFVTPDQLDDYLARQVTPLLARIGHARELTAALLQRADARGMEDYTGLVLYLDSVYGSALLRSALLETEPASGATQVHAADFLRGALTALRQADTLFITPPLPSSTTEGKESAFLIYLPAGRWMVRYDDAIRSAILTEPSLGGHEPAGRWIARNAQWHHLKLAWKSVSEVHPSSVSPSSTQIPLPALTLRKQ